MSYDGIGIDLGKRMLNFEIKDSITDVGSKGKVNDDWFAFDKRVAIVADGATGLGDIKLIEGADSDAQWVAKTLCECMVDAKADQPVRDLVLEVIMSCKEEVTKKDDLENIPRYSWPASSFIMARIQHEFIELSGLGDCGAYVKFQDGAVEAFSALPMDRIKERKEAADDLSKTRKNNETLRTPEVIKSLRAKREKANSDASGVWTVSLVEEAANRVFTVAIPITEISQIMLMSDGFSALCEVYEECTPNELLARSNDEGLEALNARLRHIERIEDPDALKFPRYKQCDDSTAIVINIG